MDGHRKAKAKVIIRGLVITMGKDLMEQAVKVMVKDKVRKGKGKGKGVAFEGECSWCGVWGHMARNCWKKDKYMDEVRAKGKGKDGGKGGKDKGGNGGYWNNYGGKGNWNCGKGYGKGGGKGYGKSDAYSWMDDKPSGQDGNGIGFGFCLERGGDDVDLMEKGVARFE